MIKSRKRLAGNLARMREMRTSEGTLVGKSGKRESLWRLRREGFI
jgi:hypothetical protein